jgi:hypothetical protein
MGSILIICLFYLFFIPKRHSKNDNPLRILGKAGKKSNSFIEKSKCHCIELISDNYNN